MPVLSAELRLGLHKLLHDAVAIQKFIELRDKILAYEAKKSAETLTEQDNAPEQIQATSTDMLIVNLEQAESTTQIIQAWREIASILNKSFWVARNNNERFSAIKHAELLEPLDQVAFACYAAFIGHELEPGLIELEPSIKDDKNLMTEIYQLMVKPENIHSLNDDPARCKAWFIRMRNFIAASNLTGYYDEKLSSSPECIGYNLEGGEYSRRYKLFNEDGEINQYPIEAIESFQLAVDRYKEIGRTLSNTNNFRHVQMCLMKVKQESITSKIFAAPELTEALLIEAHNETESIKQLFAELLPALFKDEVRAQNDYAITTALAEEADTYNANELWENFYAKIDPAALKDGADYSLSGCLQTLGLLVFFTENNHQLAKNLFATARKFMQDPKYSGQLSYLLNENANIVIAQAAANYELIEDSPVQLLQIKDHPFTNLCIKKTNFSSELCGDSKIKENYDELIAAGDSCVKEAVELLVEAYEKSFGKAENSYALQAQQHLSQIAGHPACLSNPKALQIVQAWQAIQQQTIAAEQLNNLKETLYTTLECSKDFSTYISAALAKQHIVPNQSEMAALSNLLMQTSRNLSDIAVAITSLAENQKMNDAKPEPTVTQHILPGFNLLRDKQTALLVNESDLKVKQSALSIINEEEEVDQVAEKLQSASLQDEVKEQPANKKRMLNQ